MAKTIDSKEKRLPFPEILVQSIAATGLDGIKLATQLAATVQEIQMENTIAQNIGNTIFLEHLTPDKRSAYLKVYNIDTYKNFLNNLESYIKSIKKRGTDLVAYAYEDNSSEAVFNFLREKDLAQVKTGRNDKGDMMALIMLDPKLSEGIKDA